MLVVSLHGMKIHARLGLYPQEHILGNDFEIDVDVHAATESDAALPFIDYTILQQTVQRVFEQEDQLIESFVQQIHRELKERLPIADKVKVVIRKLHPPMAGDVAYAQVCFED